MPGFNANNTREGKRIMFNLQEVFSSKGNLYCWHQLQYSKRGAYLLVVAYWTRVKAVM